MPTSAYVILVTLDDTVIQRLTTAPLHHVLIMAHATVILDTIPATVRKDSTEPSVITILMTVYRTPV